MLIVSLLVQPDERTVEDVLRISNYMNRLEVFVFFNF